MTSNRQHSSKAFLHSEYKTLLVHGFRTKTFSVDFVKPSDGRWSDSATGSRVFPHTVLVFIPGNPGLVDWYLRSFVSILNRLGPGFAARGVSNAGHGTEQEHVEVPTNDKTLASIAHSVDGQSIHKAAYMQLVYQEFSEWRASANTASEQPTTTIPGLPHWIFVSHSIGCHFIQRACILQPDILQRTRLFLHLTPFLRMSAPEQKQLLLDAVASNDTTAVTFGHSMMSAIKQLPRWIVSSFIQLSIPDGASRNTTVSLLRQPKMAANFLLLGLQEIRDVPEAFDLAAMRIVAKHCHSCVLVAGDDHWFPESHVHELKTLMERKQVTNVSVYFDRSLKHGYVLHPDASEKVVVEFCVDRILETVRGKPRI